MYQRYQHAENEWILIIELGEAPNGRPTSKLDLPEMLEVYYSLASQSVYASYVHLRKGAPSSDQEESRASVNRYKCRGSLSLGSH